MQILNPFGADGMSLSKLPKVKEGLCLKIPKLHKSDGEMKALTPKHFVLFVVYLFYYIRILISFLEFFIVLLNLSVHSTHPFESSLSSLIILTT